MGALSDMEFFAKLLISTLGGPVLSEASVSVS